MNRNITIVVIILVLVVIAGYLIWLRSRYQQSISLQASPEITATVAPTPISTPVVTASPSALPAGRQAAPGGKEATGSVKQKTATPGGVRR